MSGILIQKSSAEKPVRAAPMMVFCHQKCMTERCGVTKQVTKNRLAHSRFDPRWDPSRCDGENHMGNCGQRYRECTRDQLFHATSGALRGQRIKR